MFSINNLVSLGIIMKCVFFIWDFLYIYLKNICIMYKYIFKVVNFFWDIYILYFWFIGVFLSYIFRFFYRLNLKFVNFKWWFNEVKILLIVYILLVWMWKCLFLFFEIMFNYMVSGFFLKLYIIKCFFYLFFVSVKEIVVRFKISC